MMRRNTHPGVMGITGGVLMLVFTIIYIIVVKNTLDDSGVSFGDLFQMGYLCTAMALGAFTYPIAGIIGIIGGIIAFKDYKVSAIIIFIAAGFSLLTAILVLAWYAFVVTAIFVVAGMLCLQALKRNANNAYGGNYQQPADYVQPSEQPREPEDPFASYGQQDAGNNESDDESKENKE